jgi:hypothetical protein
MLAGLAMELAVTPMVCAWQGRIAGRLKNHSTFTSG